MTESWKDRLSAIGQSLLTIEINTVVTSGLSAQKMPEVPLALHNLVQAYGDYLAVAGFQVTEGLLEQSVTHVGGMNDASTNEGAAQVLRKLRSWPFAGRKLTVAEQKAGFKSPGSDNEDATAPAIDPTNGAETFEALQWASWAALQTLRAGGTLTGHPDSAVLSRINANCRQLKEAALRLEQQHDPQSGLKQMLGRQTATPSKTESKDRLRDLLVIREPATIEAQKTAMPTSRLFGATVEQTARALFEHPRPTFYVDPDVTILIRKAWDIGVQRVCLQTMMQVDGDLLQAIGDLQTDERDFLIQLHKSAVRDAVAQWRALFDIVRQLAGAVGSVVFRA